MPRFWVWTLGCQMNRSDSEEMAGRLLAAGCAEAPGIEDADLVVINTCAIREAAEAKVIGRQGALAALKTANPALRVVLTGCAVRERDRAGLRRRFPAVDLFLRPDEEPELVERLGLASAQAAVGLGEATSTSGPASALATPRTAATTLVKGVPVSAADHLAASRADAVASGAVRRESAGHGMAADHLRLRQDLHVLHRAVQPRTGAQPPVRRRGRRGAGARGGGLPRDHAPRPERQQLRPRPAGGGAVRPRRRGAPGRAADRSCLAAGPRRADPGDRRPPRAGREPRRAAPPLRHVAPVGPLRPAHRGDGRSARGLRGAPPAGAVRRRRGPPPDGPAVHGRPLRGAPRAHPRGDPGDRGQHGRDRRLLRRDGRRSSRRRCASCRRSATTRSSRPPTRRAPGRPRPGFPTTSPPA